MSAANSVWLCCSRLFHASRAGLSSSLPPAHPPQRQSSLSLLLSVHDAVDRPPSSSPPSSPPKPPSLWPTAPAASSTGPSSSSPIQTRAMKTHICLVSPRLLCPAVVCSPTIASSPRSYLVYTSH